MNDQASLQRIGAAQLTTLDRKQRNRRNAVAKAMRHVLGQPWVLETVLRSQLRKGAVLAGNTAARFALHPSWIQQCLGHKLQFHVPLEQITHYLGDWLQTGSRRVHTSDFFLVHGDLDPAKNPVVKLNVLREVQELVAEDWDFRRTLSYANLVRALEQQRPVMRQQVRLDTPEKIDAYFLRFHELYQSVRVHGLLSNQEAAQRLEQAADREIGVALDRDGALVKLQGGQHRFALAVALGLKTVPVELRMVHAEVLAVACRSYGCLPLQSIQRLIDEFPSSDR